LSAVYLVALVGVGISILWLLVDAVVSVSRRPRWETLQFRSLTLVSTPERRQHELPYVGAERRKAPDPVTQDDARKVA
jgi:hypothetical protein